MISHVFPNGDEQPIAYAYRALTPAESNYAQIEKDALGIVFGIKKFHQYLYGRKFTLLTDHKPLTTIFGANRGVPALAAARLQRWALQLSAYDYTIEFRSTAKHANADGLSRLPLKGTHAEEGADVRVFQVRQLDALPIVAEDVRRGTRSDRVLGKVLRFAREGWPSAPPGEEFKPYFQRKHEMSIENDCLLWGMRVIVPAVFREQLLAELHQDHPGVVKMKCIARSHMWWPGMDSAIEKVAKSRHAMKQSRVQQRLPSTLGFGQVGHGNGYMWTTQGHLWGKTSCS